MRPIAPDELAWILEAYAAGDSVEEIADLCERPTSDVETIVGGKRALSANERRACELRFLGLSYREIAARAGFKYSTVWFYLSRARAKGYPVPHEADDEVAPKPLRLPTGPLGPKDPARDAKVLQLLNAGEPPHKIARRLNLTKGQIAGIRFRAKPQSPPAIV